MRLNDIVTVKQPTSVDEVSGFRMTPGIPGVVWRLPHEYSPHVLVAVRPNLVTACPLYAETGFDNLVLIAKHNATSFNTTNVNPDKVGEVVRLLQANLKKATAYEMAKAMNQTHGQGQCYDRWGKMWTNEEIFNALIAEAQQRGGDFTESLLRATHASHLTYKWVMRDPRAKVEPKIRPTKSAYVNVYCDDRAYGGPEEGGWWYDASYCTESTKVSRKAAPQVLKIKQRECDEENEGNPPISSVLSRGFYHAKIENRPGTDYPGYRPTYS